MEQEEYTKEAIDWSYIEFVDNQDVLDLIEKVISLCIYSSCFKIKNLTSIIVILQLLILGSITRVWVLSSYYVIFAMASYFSCYFSNISAYVWIKIILSFILLLIYLSPNIMKRVARNMDLIQFFTSYKFRSKVYNSVT